MQQYRIVYSVQPLLIDGMTIHIPSANIASLKEGTVQYYYKKATPEIIQSSEIITDTADRSLLEICRENSVEEIELRYNKNKKKFRNIIDLFKEDEIKNAVLSRLNRDISFFLQKISDYPEKELFYDIQRKVFLPDIRIKTPALPFEVKIHLDKTATGLNYSLKLLIQNIEITPSEENVTILSDQPSYLLIKDRLFYNATFFAKRIIPFLNKKMIFIPQQTIPVYFNRFIKDIVRTVEVEATGFEFEALNHIPCLVLKFTENLISSHLELSCIFKYGEISFRYEDPTTNKVYVEINDNGLPKVSKIIRNAEVENQLLEKVINIGFKLNENKKLIYESGNDKFGLLYAVIDHSNELQEAGIEMTKYQLDGKEVSNKKFAIQLSYERQGDWFDINARLQIGEFEIPFNKLLNHIKNENRHYLLPDEEIFIIPEEWMTKYSLLSKFSKEEGSRLSISKSHFTVLEGLGEEKKENYSDNKLPILLPAELKADLRDYQKKGALWLISHYVEGLGACLADDMGLGKTLQTIALLQYIKENHILKNQVQNSVVQLSLFDNPSSYRNTLRALVVLPASLVFNWEAELRRFAPQLMVKRFIGQGRATKYQELEHFDVILTTYQTAQREEKLLQKLDFRVIILDESHYIKNKDTKIFKALSHLKSYQRVTLSGTPVENSLSDLWSQMQFINPNILGEYSFFNQHFKLPIEKEKNPDRIAELKKLIDPYLMRRTKKEVLKDLPPLIDQIIYSEMGDDQKSLYEKEKSAVRNQILDLLDRNEQVNKINVLNALMRLRQLSNHPEMVGLESGSSKFDDVTSYVENLLRSGHSVLIFSSFVKHLELYEKYFETKNINYAKLTGELDEKNRKLQVEKFMNEDNCPVFLMSIKAGGVGLNLTKAGYVVILDPWWNPFVEQQAIARAHRMGQENKVTVLRFITKDTIEEKILLLQKSKFALAAEFVDVGEFPELDRKNIDFLIN